MSSRISNKVFRYSMVMYDRGKLFEASEDGQYDPDEETPEQKLWVGVISQFAYDVKSLSTRIKSFKRYLRNFDPKTLANKKLRVKRPEDYKRFLRNEMSDVKYQLNHQWMQDICHMANRSYDKLKAHVLNQLDENF